MRILTGVLLLTTACGGRAGPAPVAVAVAAPAAAAAPVAVAEPEPEPEPRTPDEWIAAAAEAYDAIAVDPLTLDEERLAAMRSAVDAWKQAFRVRAREDADRPHELRMVASFLRLADALGSDDPAAVSLSFLAANWYRHDGDLDRALPLFATIVRDHPAHEVAEYAANRLLDLLNLAERYDELVAWAEEMRASPALLEGRPDLQGTVDRIHDRALELQAEREAGVR